MAETYRVLVRTADGRIRGRISCKEHLGVTTRILNELLGLPRKKKAWRVDGSTFYCQICRPPSRKARLLREREQLKLKVRPQ